MYRAEHRILNRLDEIVWLLHHVIKGERIMAAELEGLIAQVTINTDVELSAIQAIEGLAARLDAAIASGDPAKLVELSTSLRQSADALGAAVAANT